LSRAFAKNIDFRKNILSEVHFLWDAMCLVRNDARHGEKSFDGFSSYSQDHAFE